MSVPSIRHILSRSTWPEAQAVTAALRTETVGGALLLGAALTALMWVNSPLADSYLTLRDARVGPAALHLDLSVGQWAADGLLAVFFFVAGLELKREFVVGDLRDPAKAVVPIVAAACGVTLPALIFLSTVHLSGYGAEPGILRGWAVPTATDIAFALAVLAVIGTHLPSALRSFLLTLAVVDDLIAICIIAAAYTSHLAPVMLLAALIPLLLFGWLLRRAVTSPWLLVPLAVATWTLTHQSGVHATVAGVLLGLLVPIRADHEAGVRRPLEQRIDYRMRPLSAGVAVPLFALFAAGVKVTGGGASQAFADPAALAVAAALILGKLVGVLGGTWLTARFTRAQLDPELTWSDVTGLSLLAGIGFTVSLLITELAYGADGARHEHVKIAVLVGSFLAAVLAAIVLRRRNAEYRKIAERETRDEDDDGIPDVFASGSGPGR